MHSVNRYEVSFLIGGVKIGEEYTLYYYNAAANKVFEVEDKLSLNLGTENGGSLGYGKFSDPHPIEISLFTATVQKQDVFCTADNTGFIEITPIDAFSPTYAWSHDDTATGNRVEGLAAGSYTVSIKDIRNVPVTKTIEILNQSNDIIAPTVIGAADPICLGSSIALIASSESPDAEFRWFDAEGTELGAGTQLILNNRQETETIKVLALINGVCQSDFTDVPIVVSSVGSASFEVSDENPEINNQTVTFTPITQSASYMYAWDFGDGQTSTEMIAQHIYTTMGPFNVSLTIASPDNCEASSVSINVVSTHEPTCGISFDLNGELPEGIHRQAENITSAGTVEAGSNVELRAGTSIVLSPGFHAKAASTFLAMIDPCTENLEEPAAPATQRTAPVTTTTILPTIDELNLAPNPTSGSTKISFKLGNASNIHLEIYDPKGGLVRRLINGDFYPSGNHEVTFLPDNLTYGIYHVVLKNERQLITKKLIIVR